MPAMPNPLVISGCSGSGKSTLIQYLTSRHPSYFQLNPSYTTRPPRPAQTPGRDYIFVSLPQFHRLQSQHAFIQAFQVHGNWYGTHQGKMRQIRSQGKVCVLDMDLQGGEAIWSMHQHHREWQYVFVAPPSLQELRVRLEGRGTEGRDKIQRRLANAKVEMEKIGSLGFYRTIVNRDLDQAKKQLIEHLNTAYKLELIV